MASPTKKQARRGTSNERVRGILISEIDLEICVASRRAKLAGLVSVDSCAHNPDNHICVHRLLANVRFWRRFHSIYAAHS